MTDGYQIEEMVHQDAKGVVFRGVEKATGKMVAIRRFFLDTPTLKELGKKKKDGRTVFEVGLEWLKSLEASSLRRVIAGGQDSVDGTPYVVTAWWEGKNFAQAYAAGELKECDAVSLHEDAGELWGALPEAARRAVSFAEKDVFVEKTNGRVTFLFWICPLRYFSEVAGFTSEGGQEGDWLGMVNRLQALGGSASAFRGELVDERPKVVLKSAQSSGAGVIWAVCSLLLLACVGSGWWMLQQDQKQSIAREKTRAEPSAETKQERAKADLSAVNEESEDIVEQNEGVPDLPELEEEEMAEEELVEGVLEEKRPRGDISADESFGASDEEGDEESQKVAKNVPIFKADQVDELEEIMGEGAIVEGEVVKADQSRTKKTWYLYFKTERENETGAVVAFMPGKHARASFADWQALLSKELRVMGRVSKIRRGSLFTGTGLTLNSMDRIEMIGDPSPLSSQ